MTARTKVGALAGIAGIALLCPVAAQAKTKTVSMGVPAKSQKAFGKFGADVNDFFPHGVTIHVGDKVRFTPGFHTVDLPAKGGKPLPLLSPGAPVSGSTDEAGAQFWFNGQPQLGFTPALGQPGFGKSFTYRGKSRVLSGLPFVPNPKPMTVKFAKAGRYTYYCNLHPGMKGTVKVLKRGRSIPSARKDRKALKRQIKRDLKIARNAAKRKAPANTVDVGVAGRHGVEVFAMVPGNLTVARGTTLRFRMTPGSFEAHTATFGPGPIDQPSSYLGALAASFESPTIDPRATYPSDVPTTTATLTSALHGNGFWNSGVMDASSATPLPGSGSVTFGAPGTYRYYCLIHPFMTGTITVT